MTGAALKFYVVCLVLQQFVFAPVGIPFWLNAVLMVVLIWLYTHRGGIKTLVVTDTVQTLCLLTSLLLIIYKVAVDLGLSFGEAVQTVADSPMSRIFVTDDWTSPYYFWKQFVSGVFIVVVMTGLDQDMMQKNLTCRTLSDARKDMCSYGVAFVPVNLLFLSLGVLLTMLPASSGATGDALLPAYVSSFLADGDSIAASAGRTHAVMCLLFVLFILLFHSVNSTSLIDAIYTMVSYTYGPLLGLFAFGLFTRRSPADRHVPYICVASPLLCFGADALAQSQWDYHFGYELLMLNGLLTFSGLWLSSLYTRSAGRQTPS